MPRPRNIARHRLLLELANEGELTTGVMQHVLSRAERTCQHYLAGETPLNLNQCADLAMRLNRPEFISAWLQDHGFNWAVRPMLVLHAGDPDDGYFQNQMLTMHSVDDLFRFLDEATEDGHIDSTEARKIQRLMERAVNQLAQVVLPSMDRELLIV